MIIQKGGIIMKKLLFAIFCMFFIAGTLQSAKCVNGYEVKRATFNEATKTNECIIGLTRQILTCIKIANSDFMKLTSVGYESNKKVVKNINNPDQTGSFTVSALTPGLATSPKDMLSAYQVSFSDLISNKKYTARMIIEGIFIEAEQNGNSYSDPSITCKLYKDDFVILEVQ